MYAYNVNGVCVICVCYSAIFERNHGFLMQSLKSGTMPSLMNIQVHTIYRPKHIYVLVYAYIIYLCICMCAYM